MDEQALRTLLQTALAPTASQEAEIGARLMRAIRAERAPVENPDTAQLWRCFTQIMIRGIGAAVTLATPPIPVPITGGRV